MPDMPDECIDLIYIDPPFGTQTLWKSKAFNEKVQDLQFYDIWGKGINGYINFMVERLRHMHRLLKPNGVLCVHLDWRMSHYIKIELDKIFGVKNPASNNTNFINEIIWNYNRWTAKSKSFQKVHDTILIYSKGKDYTFNTPMVDHSADSLNEYRYLEKPNGKIITLNKAQLLGCSCEEIPIGNRFRTLRRKDTKGTPQDRQYLKDFPQVRAGSILKIPFAGKNERTGWPTQKPLALLDVFIKTFTNRGDLVADFFCGCGTTIVAAQRLNRKWIGFDASMTACKVMLKRIKEDQPLL